MFTKDSTIGFIGLGNMGSGMTKNLQKNGFQLVVNDVREEAAAQLIANGAKWAKTGRPNPSAMSTHSVATRSIVRRSKR